MPRDSQAVLQRGDVEMRRHLVWSPVLVLRIDVALANPITSADCQPGTCHSGACIGFPSEYSMDGKCGPKYGGLKCGGKWGDCCNFNGQCGTGTGFCNPTACQSGNCTQPPPPSTPGNLPWQTGTTPDGTCGGPYGYTCDVVFGTCCSAKGICGSLMAHCGTGW